MKLEEGQYYKFKPLKTITLPDASESMVLHGPDGKKYLLPLSPYPHFNLKDKTEIKCKVDKINCTGKVFLEPEHPVYREGEYYSFIIDSLQPGGKMNKDDSILFTVFDAYGNPVTGNIEILGTTVKPGQEVKMRIERISKGRIHFSKPAARESANELAEGESYEFKVKTIITGDEGDEYYVVTDIFNNIHQLPVRYYNHYGFMPGTSFRGRIIRYSPGSPKTIEPENPWYSSGDIVETTVENAEYDETLENYIVELCDNKGFLYIVRMNKKPERQILKCSVLKIRKGRPVLVPLDEE
jgi:hypothetical protein